MSAFPAATRVDHQRFCETEGWRLVRNARGRAGTHHVTYELPLPDGSILRTRISHPPDRSTYGKALWGHIRADQLKVSDEEFWVCVRDGTPPRRAASARPEAALPASLVHQLVVRFHVPEAEVVAMSKQDAVDRLAELWSCSD